MRPATAGEVKACWESMKEPSSRKVSDKLKAAGLTASNKHVAKLKREGWPGADQAPLITSKAATDDAMGVVAAVITGDPAAPPPLLLSAIVGLSDDTKNSTLTEVTYREVMLACRRYLVAIDENRAKLATDAPEAAANAIGRIVVTVRQAHEGLSCMPNLREGEMKDVAGTVEVLPPLEKHRKNVKDHVLRASLEAYGKVLGEETNEHTQDTAGDRTPEPAAGPDGGSVEAGESLPAGSDRPVAG